MNRANMSNSKVHLYDKLGNPRTSFNKNVRGWLADTVKIHEHTPTAAFEPLRLLYDKTVEAIEGKECWDIHKEMLSNLTKLLCDPEAALGLADRLSSEPINAGGIRSALAQGQVKNTGENFINAIVYALSECLSNQDEILVDKGLPKFLRPTLTLNKEFSGTKYDKRVINIPIEVDFIIFRRSDPTNAILVNAKTRMKEISHIPPFWKLLKDTIGDADQQKKWGLTGGATSLSNMLYVFVTADNISKEGVNTQGCDVDRDDPRNLIAMDAAFMDYAFVSKQGIKHVSETLSVTDGREALFHELGCLLDLVRQKFNLE